MNLYSRIRKAIVGQDFSRGFVSEMVRGKAGDLMGMNIGDSKKILYVGCGEGLFLLKNARRYRNAEHVGLDNWPRILDHVNQKIAAGNIANARTVFAEGHRLPFEKDKFGLVFFINGIFNQPNKDEIRNIVNEMLRVVVPGGKIYFDFRNSGNVMFRLFYDISLRLDSTKPMVKLYSKKEISNIVKGLEYRGMNFIPVNFSRVDYIVEMTK